MKPQQEMRWETERQLVESMVNSARGTVLVAAMALPAKPVLLAEMETPRSLAPWVAFAALNSARASMVM